LPVTPIPDLPVRVPPSAVEEEIVYSRTVQATVGQTIEIPFRGKGWVYLGELQSRPGVEYVSKRDDAEGQSFVFRAEAPGTFELKFSKQDFIRDYILNDHVRVIVSDAPEPQNWFAPPVDRGTVVASPRWPSVPAEDAPASTGTTPEAATNTPAQTAPVTTPAASGTAPAAIVSDTVSPPPTALPEPDEVSAPSASVPTVSTPAESAPEELLRQAREALAGGSIAQGLAVLDRFREQFPAGSDEAWWLYGQLLEANGPDRDIRAALDYYRRLVQEYPQSPRYDEARRRIAYLERFYLNIR
jgi:hypothetical protein